jgi:phosphoglycerate dehydrogenase-like enzyme
LDCAPKLKAIFYAAGAIGSWVTDAVWDRNILVTTASVANAQPVAEYTLACILFSLKHGWKLMRQTRAERWFPPRDAAPGNYGSTVGLASLGLIGRNLLKLLRPFDLNVLVYDPFVTALQALELGVEKVSLEELFRRGDVVSIHTPSLPETQGMITGAHLAGMKHGATFINTARGELVREQEMIEVLKNRPDLQAVLDVSEPEPPAADSPLYTLDNVVMTPHIAGSAGNECRRLGRYMVDELNRYVAGEPLKYVVTPEAAEHSCHRPAVSVKAGRHKPGSGAVVEGRVNA